jgi:hypothetical protein
MGHGDAGGGRLGTNLRELVRAARAVGQQNVRGRNGLGARASGSDGDDNAETAEACALLNQVDEHNDKEIAEIVSLNKEVSDIWLAVQYYILAGKDLAAARALAFGQ